MGSAPTYGSCGPGWLQAAHVQPGDRQAQEGAGGEDGQPAPIGSAQQHKGSQQVGFGEGAQEGPLLDPHVRESSTTTSSPSAQASFSCRNAVERCSDHAVARAAATTNTSSARRTTSGKVPNWRAPRANCQMPAKGRPSRSDPWANGATPQARHKTTCQASGIPTGTANV